MKKDINPENVAEHIRSGMTVAIGGFLSVGIPKTLIRLLAMQPVGQLTVISNDTGFPGDGVGMMVERKQVKKAIVSHIGTNPETGRQMNQGEMAVELVPQGTLAERLRCGGSGLGGVLTPTGLGTVVAENKTVLTVAGKEYLLETPLRADVALVKAWKADTAGNLVCRRAARNFNPLMALAADTVIAEVEEIVAAGEIDPDQVTIPGVLVDYICLAEKEV
ncbi:MAG TPA: CoA transferase subunit A [Patescibacteria group bacterium]|nr:CoA transferase subunit A [Patescibacteria group bacterium]